jgi:uncharacterized protein (TIGR00255 family)
MKSMTGFGRRDNRDDRRAICVEIRTINHRYKDFFVKVPPILKSLETKIRDEAARYVARGRIEICIQFETFDSQQKQIVLNKALACEYIKTLNTIKTMDAMISDEINIDLIARFPDVIIVSEAAGDDAANWQALKPVLDGALAEVSAGREQEGLALQADIQQRLAIIQDHLQAIRERAPQMLTAYRKQVYEKVAALLGDASVDENRLLTEAAIMADKLDISEELTRLDSHLARMAEMIKSEGAIGRQLDFLIQEINREVNTIGSKATDIRISDAVVDVKSEIEKIREQIQNIE